MRRNLTLIAVAIAFLVTFTLIGCTGAGIGNDTAPANGPTLALQDTTVSALGEVVPERWASLAFASGGSELDILVSIGELVKTGDVLATVNNIAQQAAVSNAASALSSAEANLERLQDLEASDSDISVAQKAVDAAQANLAQAQESLDATELKAPFDGMIIDLFLRDFETALPNQPVVLLADLTTLVIETNDLSEVDVARVQISDPVTVVFDALPDISVTGSVIQIALSPETGAGTYYTVTIKLEEIPEDLRWGMSAFVEIEAGTNTPMAALATSTPTQTPVHSGPSQTLTLTSITTYTPTRTSRPYEPPPTSTLNGSGSGNQEPASPTATRTHTATPPPTATFTLTQTSQPSQPIGSPTVTNTHRPIILVPTYTLTPSLTDTPSPTATP